MKLYEASRQRQSAVSEICVEGIAPKEGMNDDGKPDSALSTAQIFTTSHKHMTLEHKCKPPLSIWLSLFYLKLYASTWYHCVYRGEI